MCKRHAAGWLMPAFILFALLLTAPPATYAQSLTTVQCGSSLRAQFPEENLEHEYLIGLAAGTRLTVRVDAEADTPRTRVRIIGPSGLLINDTGDFYLIDKPEVETFVVSARGTYRILVNNAAGQGGGGTGDYTLNIGCLMPDGSVVNPGDPPPALPEISDVLSVPLAIFDTQGLAAVRCGEVIGAEFATNNQWHTYQLTMPAGTPANFRAQATALGSPNSLRMQMVIHDPAGNVIAATDNFYLAETPALQTFDLSARGVYSIYVGNIARGGDGGVGFYTLAVGCALPDGRLVNPGDAPVDAPAMPETLSVPLASFEGQGVRAVRCGEIIGAEFTANNQSHRYQFEAAPGAGAFYRVTASPLGAPESLRFYMEILDPAGNRIAATDDFYLATAPTLETFALSARGIYSLNLRNVAREGGGRTGFYTLALSCALPDGTLIGAGDELPPDAGSDYEEIPVYVPVVAAQSLVAVQCGEVVGAEFTENNQQHIYLLEMTETGDNVKFWVSATPLGAPNSLRFHLDIHAPDESRLAATDDFYLATTPRLETPPLPVAGTYRLYVQNVAREGGGRTGFYTLAVGCVRADGTLINPAESLTPAETQPPTTLPADFNGFRGLPPVDFSAMVRLPLTVGTPLASALTPDGAEVYGFEWEGVGGGAARLAVTRLSGNLNLGVVVIGPDGTPVAQWSLIGAQQVEPLFYLPADGRYTAVVYRLESVLPTPPEATAFQVTLQND